MMNYRLADWYGIDTAKDLGLSTHCTMPFDTLLVDSKGSCFICDCQAWLPYSVGNLQFQSIEEVFNSARAKHLRNSIKDGSYRYCNEKQCAWLLDKHNAPGWPSKPKSVTVENIRLAVDESCNLSCPSCRTRTIFIKDKHKIRAKTKLTNKIIQYVARQSHNINMHLGSDGDPFASLIYRDFLKRSRHCKNMRFTITTNGLLISKMYHKNQHVFERLDELNVSVDGATDQTYEKLRRGGKFEILCDNLKFLKDIKQKHGFKLRLHFVIQCDNYKEMTEMAHMGIKYLADSVWLNRITNWNTFDNFEQMDVCDQSHSEHELFIQQLNKLKDMQKDYDKKFLQFPTLS